MKEKDFKDSKIYVQCQSYNALILFIKRSLFFVSKDEPADSLLLGSANKPGDRPGEKGISKVLILKRKNKLTYVNKLTF